MDTADGTPGRGRWRLLLACRLLAFARVPCAQPASARRIAILTGFAPSVTDRGRRPELEALEWSECRTIPFLPPRAAAGRNGRPAES